MKSDQIIVYTNESSLRHPLSMIKEMVNDLIKSRELAIQLALRDIRAQYRQTILGLIWAFVLPLANTAVWLFIQQAGIVKVQETSVPYSVYVLTGTILWSIFMDAVNSPLQQTTAAKPMLAKINFPREAIVLSGIFQTFINASIKIIVLIAALLLLGVYPSFKILLFPISVLSIILAGTAFGLLITPVGLLYGDIGKGLPLLMQFFMYITPVVFPMPKDGLSLILFRYNPISPLILIARDLLVGHAPEYIYSFLIINSFMLLLLLLMWIVYRAAMPILIERMSA